MGVENQLTSGRVSDISSPVKSKETRFRRSWVKIWIHAWFDSSLRALCSNDERGIFADFLALAGKSRYNGIIAAGEEQGKLVGYPMRILVALCISWSQEQLEAALAVHEMAGRIEVERQELRTKETGYVIRITGWEKWQSEYDRTKKYYEAKKSIQALDPKFVVFWEAYPRKVNKLDAQRAWQKLAEPDKDAAVLGIGKWKLSEQWSTPKFIPHPATFLNKRTWEGEPAGKEQSHNDSRIHRTLEAAKRAMERAGDSGNNEMRSTATHGSIGGRH